MTQRKQRSCKVILDDNWWFYSCAFVCIVCKKTKKKKNIVIIKSNSIKHQDRQNWLTGGPSRGVERQHSLQSHKCERDAEGLEHQLHHPLPVLHRVHGGFGQQHRVILGTHRQLLERVMPDLQQRPRETNTKKQQDQSPKWMFSLKRALMSKFAVNVSVRHSESSGWTGKKVVRKLNSRNNFLYV